MKVGVCVKVAVSASVPVIVSAGVPVAEGCGVGVYDGVNAVVAVPLGVGPRTSRHGWDAIGHVEFPSLSISTLKQAMPGRGGAQAPGPPRFFEPYITDMKPFDAVRPDTWTRISIPLTDTLSSVPFKTPTSR